MAFTLVAQPLLRPLMVLGTQPYDVAPVLRAIAEKVMGLGLDVSADRACLFGHPPIPHGVFDSRARLDL